MMTRVSTFSSYLLQSRFYSIKFYTNLIIFSLSRICVSMFTTVPAIVQVYLNDEPLFSYQPENLDNQQALAGNANGLGAASNITQKLDR